MAQFLPYQRCMVMAGGGFHFGYYLGAYAALCEQNKAPDILLASCGGAIAASIIATLPTDAARKAWLQSLEMYNYWRGLSAKADATLIKLLMGAAKRRVLGHNAKYIPDLFNDYMFDIPTQLPLPNATQAAFDALNKDKNAPDIAIVAGKLLYQESQVGQPRGSQKLFAQTIFCSPKAAQLVAGMTSPLSAMRYGDTAIAPEMHIATSMPIADAVRASVSDMYYFRCHSHESGDYIGGVVDLFPIEVARKLAQQVVMEKKSGYDKWLGVPAIKAVLGFDGNQRLSDVLQQPADIWFDTTDMETVFEHQRIKQHIQFLKNKITIKTPASFDEYAKIIDAQWAFGYERAMLGLSSKK